MAEDYSKNYFTPKNIVLYLVIGALVYGAVYYLFLSNKGSSYTAPPAELDNSTQVTPTNTVAMDVILDAQNDSGETGTVTLTEVNGKTKVIVTVQNEPAGASQPAHIHLGACPTPGAVEYPLSNVVNGTSETVLDVDLATIKSKMPLAINVHKSAEEVKVYVACGDLQ